jgi:hypothetical protein
MFRAPKSCRRLFFMVVPLVLLTACQAPPSGPDLSLQDASDAQLHSRIQTTCMGTQGKLTGGSYDALWQPCECYATKTLKALDKPEKAALRANGVFNDTARDKALKALDVCQLKQP